jgi:hypothetical protein
MLDFENEIQIHVNRDGKHYVGVIKAGYHNWAESLGSLEPGARDLWVRITETIFDDIEKMKSQSVSFPQFEETDIKLHPLKDILTKDHKLCGKMLKFLVKQDMLTGNSFVSTYKGFEDDFLKEVELNLRLVWSAKLDLVDRRNRLTHFQIK